MYDNQKFLTHISNYGFVIEHYDGYITLESFTFGGVNLVVTIRKTEDYAAFLYNYLSDFDMGDEIDLARQEDAYRARFTIADSVLDFTKYEKMMYKMLLDYAYKKT